MTESSETPEQSNTSKNKRFSDILRRSSNLLEVRGTEYLEVFRTDDLEWLLSNGWDLGAQWDEDRTSWTVHRRKTLSLNFK